MVERLISGLRYFQSTVRLKSIATPANLRTAYKIVCTRRIPAFAI
jgi:hypothetical protein